MRSASLSNVKIQSVLLQGSLQHSNLHLQQKLSCLPGHMLFYTKLSYARKETTGMLASINLLALSQCGAARLRERPVARDADVGQPLLYHQAASGALYDVHKVDVAVTHLAHLRPVCMSLDIAVLQPW